MSASNEIRIVRIYDAPLKAVWDAWTDPAQTAQWWGPRGFTLTTHSKDLRTGGSWDYTMHGPDGTDYPNKTHYLEVEPLAKLVYDHGASDDRPPMFRVTVLFSEVEGKTHMDMCMSLPTAEAAAQTRKFVRKAGGNATWDRLAEYLAKRLMDQERFVINRSFDAPLATMFDMWTKPAHFSRWLAPTGFDMRFIRADIRTGGSSMYSMSSPAFTMYGRAHYEEVRSPDRLVYTQQFCDEHKNIARHPMAPTWPETMRTTVDLTAEGPDRTRVTVTSEVVGQATAEELATFLDGRAGMTQGWTGSFDKLDAVLAGGV
ncbi:SRPBCC family protein [Massilia glaciei]|uniref:Activator of Hsp90 ATPase homologue 1/2-like C-terminal domain-containing protein n=1 Tax=Massilia glaciei TaxID=1524097 RepID=A0A2U2HLT8_9BURK|nr:SRPBCC family protein [Massilia glaciei]PWF48402.1 hypothetical protein C7C56_011805 [Massilia glaciei]